MEDYKMGHHTETRYQGGNGTTLTVPPDPRRVSLTFSSVTDWCRIWPNNVQAGEAPLFVGAKLTDAGAGNDMARSLTLTPANVGQLLYGGWSLVPANGAGSQGIVDVIALPALDKLITGKGG